MTDSRHEGHEGELPDPHALQEMQRVVNEDQIYAFPPTERQRLGKYTIIGLILNRTIGTGIFAQPSNVLFLTGSPAVAIVLWFFGGLVILAITLSWLELALTIPRTWIDGAYFWTPRSGGDKNYLEYIYKKPYMWISCVFGITFILFGNLAGNAIQFGIYMQAAISPHCNQGDACYSKVSVIFWAIFVLCFCSFLNICTRRVFINLINYFALAKLLLVIITTFLGIIYGTVHGGGCSSNITGSNHGPGGEFGDIVLAMFFAMYSYTGFEQPFYVLAEIDQPQRYFVRYTLIAVTITLVMFPLTNIGYLCVVPYKGSASVPENMALAFFDIIARNGDDTADTTGSQQAISVLLALIIIGTIMSQTFTGALVKQEIAREAIIPFYKAIARSSDSLIERLIKPKEYRSQRTNPHYLEDHPEQVPIAATVLHVGVAVLLVIVVGASTDPSTAYRTLTYLRVFSIIVVLGLLTVGGLLYLKIDSLWHGIPIPPRRHHNKEDDFEMQPQHAAAIAAPETGDNDVAAGGQKRGRRWLEKRQWSIPWPNRLRWLDPLANFVACAALALMAFGVCVSPSQIRESDRNKPYWTNPLIGWLVTLIGSAWYLWRRYRWNKTKLIVVPRRLPKVDVVSGKAVWKGELIEFEETRTRDVPGL